MSASHTLRVLPLHDLALVASFATAASADVKCPLISWGGDSIAELASFLHRSLRTLL